MKNFELCTPTKIYFGRGREKEAGAIIASLGCRKPLVYFGGGSARRTGLLAAVETSIMAAGLTYAELGGVQPNPTVEFCEKTVEFIRAQGCDMILAVGSGSVMDSAKIAAHCVRTGHQPWEYSTKKFTPTDSLPVGVIVTIAATGSETSCSAVLTNTALGLKRGVDFDANRPAFAIMDPELTFSLPDYQTACGTVDILMHTMERYLCQNEDNELVDQLAEGLCRSVIAAGRVVKDTPDDYEARATLLYAASLSHNGLTGAGRSFKMMAHPLEHEMGGYKDTIAHGAGLAVVWPAYLTWLWRRGLATERLTRMAVNIWGCPMDFAHPEKTVKAGIDACRAYFALLGMPATLGELGLGEESIGVMAERYAADSSRDLFAHMGKAEAEEIYRLCL